MGARRFVLAIAVSAGLVLSAPYVGQVRSAIRQAFPGHFVLVVGALIVVLLVAGIAAGVRRIRDRRARDSLIVPLSPAGPGELAGEFNIVLAGDGRLQRGTAPRSW